jgi:hypothetical protein
MMSNLYNSLIFLLSDVNIKLWHSRGAGVGPPFAVRKDLATGNRSTSGWCVIHQQPGSDDFPLLLPTFGAGRRPKLNPTHVCLRRWFSG